MGRNKKTVEFDENKFSGLSLEEKLKIFSDYNELFHYELSKIPYNEYKVENEVKLKAELIAKKYYEDKGFDVYQSKVNDGYRSIGALFYWLDHISKLTPNDMEMISKISSILNVEEIKDLAYAVKDKNGTPDLLLIKENKMSFVEVKYNYETVKPATIEFYIKYNQKWTISILRVIK